VVKGVIDSHGWEIHVESPVFPTTADGGGTGCRFRIVIPY
jgi:signal transduction histidine kinase